MCLDVQLTEICIHADRVDVMMLCFSWRDSESGEPQHSRKCHMSKRLNDNDSQLAGEIFS